MWRAAPWAAVVLSASSHAWSQAPPASGGRLFGTDEDTTLNGNPRPAQPVVMRLAYGGAAGCPGEQAFRDAVGAHVRGWEPFAPNAPWRLGVTVAQRPTGYTGSAELRDVTGS